MRKDNQQTILYDDKQHSLSMSNHYLKFKTSSQQRVQFIERKRKTGRRKEHVCDEEERSMYVIDKVAWILQCYENLQNLLHFSNEYFMRETR